MNTEPRRSRPRPLPCLVRLLCLGALPVLLAAPAAAQSLRLQVPSALPRGQHLGDYSPWIAFSYSGIRAQPCTLKVWLLEENNWHCASTQWCERSFAVGSAGESSLDGTLQMASPFDVFDYGPQLAWVARLFDGSGVEVASAKAQSKAVRAAPPALKAVGKRVGVSGQPLQIRLEASSRKGESVSFRVHNAPDGVQLDPATGVLRWTPGAPGLYRVVVEAVCDATQLADAEIVELDIASAEVAGAVSHAAAE
jgi:hypothetical protein